MQVHRQYNFLDSFRTLLERLEDPSNASNFSSKHFPETEQPISRVSKVKVSIVRVFRLRESGECSLENFERWTAVDASRSHREIILVTTFAFSI